MAGLVVFGLVAAVGSYFVWSAQKFGAMRRFGGRRFYPEQPISPRLITREADPKAFHDALVIRWAGVGLFPALGVGCAVAQGLGISN